MSFREWLPITRRNRVALGFSLFSLVVFVTWNCVPVSDFRGVNRIFGVELWPGIVSYKFYVNVFKSPDLDGLMAAAACFSIFPTAAMSLLSLPLWKFFHVSPVLRIPIATACLAGALVVFYGILWGDFGHGSGSGDVAIFLISLNMFSVSAALFTFKNELALRSERSISQTRDL
jgi:hypothetical protein